MPLQLRAPNAHEIRLEDGRRLLFHPPTTGLFEVDAVGAAVLDLFRERAEVEEADIRERFDGRFPPEAVVETLDEFLRLDIIGGAAPAAHPAARIPAARIPARVWGTDTPLSTIVLSVNTGCNLSCTYCYKEDLTTPDKGDRMDFETAARAVDLLLAQAGARRRVNVVFFGGEPLTNMPLIRQVVAYAERRGAEAGKTIDFSLTTNGTLLTEERVDYFAAHRFGLTVSMDGPAAMHDRNRKTIGGKGTHATVAAKARMLLARYHARPVGARVTLTSGVTDVVRIHEHLRDDLGFFEVGFSPVTSGQMAAFNLSDAETASVFAGLKRLGRRYLAAALRDENTGFANMHQLMSDLHLGTNKALPCGAGHAMLAVDSRGDLNLCHRFLGSDLTTFGTVTTGVDRVRLEDFLARAQDKTGRDCATCRIRGLCAGGCYHESYARFADPLQPTYHYCELMRDWVDFGISTYAAIAADNPGFFERHVAPRRAH